MELNNAEQAYDASALNNPAQGFDSTAPIVSVQIVDYDGELPPDANVVDITQLMQVSMTLAIFDSLLFTVCTCCTF